jgi:uracil-DNA glycosylase family 4
MVDYKRLSCPKQGCVKPHSCGSMPLEIHGDPSVDVMFVTEFPGKQEVEDQRYMVGKHGTLFRNVIQRLEQQYKFSWALTGVIKFQSHPKDPGLSTRAAKMCGRVLKKEIEYCKPKVIVAMGELVYEFFHDKKCPYGDMVECGRMEKVNEQEILFTLHPSYYTRSDFCSVGVMYEDMRKAIDFAINDIDWRVKDKFETNVITNLPQLKDVLTKMSKSENIICVDTEDRNLNRVYDNDLLSLQLCNDGKVGHVLPYEHFESPFTGSKRDSATKLLHEFFYGRTKASGYLFVNAKFDLHQIFRVLNKFSLNAPILDIPFAAFSLEENWIKIHGFPQGKGRFSLFTQAYIHGFDFYKRTSSKEKRDRLAHLPLAEWVEYAAADVVAPWNIYQKLLQQAERTNYLKGFKKLNEKYCNHIMRAMTYVEHCGLSISLDKVNELSSKSSMLGAGLANVVKQFYELDNVQKANEILVKKELGMPAKGLFGETRIWNPSKKLHKDLLFFDVMKLDPVEEDDNEESNTTGKEFQEAYSDLPEVALLSEFQTMNKIKTGFVIPLSKMLRKTSVDASVDMYTDKRSRCSFTNDATTGRLKSYKPNQQQRPKGKTKYAKAILAMYEAKPGRIAIKVDYSTFEVRGLGFLSEDEAMISSFTEMHKMKLQFRKDPLCFAEDGYDFLKVALDEKRKELRKRKRELNDYLSSLSKDKRKEVKETYLKEVADYKQSVKNLEDKRKNTPLELSELYLEFVTDFHRRSAALFNNISIPEVTKDQRQGAKNLVFGSVYGRTVQSIAKVLNVEEKIAQDYYDKFMAAMPQAVGWLERSKKLGRKHLHVQSPIGRRRRLWGHLHSIGSITSKMDRFSMNSVIQGFCSDLNLIAASLMIYVFEAHNKAKYQVPDEEAWFLTNLIHDSTEIDIPVEDLLYFLLVLEKIFTDYLQLYVKLAFGYEIKVPVEVDVEVGLNYSTLKKWNGSKEHAKELQKWALKEIKERDGIKKKANLELFKEFGPSIVKNVITSQ